MNRHPVPANSIVITAGMLRRRWMGIQVSTRMTRLCQTPPGAAAAAPTAAAGPEPALTETNPNPAPEWMRCRFWLAHRLP